MSWYELRVAIGEPKRGLSTGVLLLARHDLQDLEVGLGHAVPSEVRQIAYADIYVVIYDPFGGGHYMALPREHGGDHG